MADVQAGGGSVHVWGAIWKNGRSNLVILESSVNGAMYEHVIRTHLLPAVADKENWILQQDNAHAHRCRRIQEAFAALHITVLPWPSRSPDLNPIEHVWDYLGRELNKSFPQTLGQLERHLMEAWRRIPTDFVNTLVDSMTRRVGAVISASGGPTRL